ncbi:glucose-6-phosphate 1-dehydrogenase family protein [Moraxella bovis]|uniref:glucose-6-phosphate 1-dehydrogenase family protein n=1 Tax=Moraxella bovis TaxID=476 RepID=UPI00222722AE|nr:glucose-6-phosphate 1-dehydrogenase family protein [Moraxella bovis]UYZ69618.1 glucose-6-phosphate 1-dehydrogenase family protein [Moraxella bovis]UYZ71992.1 glucose-6-phosphate 1-dehydrogenase family protein [Moraxella bovis]UYZ74438.1 glucose-6-phosphate 1-dehydrogenase family protein [Moraxella bovis]UZA15307.1 glucose-6-phosphate 1-dehydrogenase family protein [Moraxella bovis]UZA28718.1 glucose-6-phosphate 1-dehydrogenase family protein [Moraxella bovis]
MKYNHKTTWQVFKAFNLKVYQNLPMHFAKPHIENWCNGWEIRRHFFAYYKYDSYLGNAPIIVVILNRQRLIVALTWHSYRVNSSNSTLEQFNNWINEIDWAEFDDFYFWHSRVSEYGDFKQAHEFDDEKVELNAGEFYRLGKFIDKDKLDDFSDDELAEWVGQAIERLSGVYEWCH